MAHYLVTWVIDIETDTPQEAAKEALNIQRSDSDAVVFTVKNMDNGVEHQIDLED
jgi:hypothetical protein